MGIWVRTDCIFQRIGRKYLGNEGLKRDGRYVSLRDAKNMEIKSGYLKVLECLDFGSYRVKWRSKGMMKLSLLVSWRKMNQGKNR